MLANVGSHIRLDYGIWGWEVSIRLRSSYGRPQERRLEQSEPRRLRRSLAAVGDPELIEDVGDVRLDGAWAEKKGLGDLFVSLPLRQQPQNVDLALRQPAGI